jgi:hypothetical protein
MEVSTFIRFQDDKGAVYYGEPSQENLSSGLPGSIVNVLNGDPFEGFRLSGMQAKVANVCH